MRKFLIAALAALASIALASVAVAQSQDVSATTSVSPKKAGTKKKPQAAKITTFVKNNIEGSTASKIEIDFPKTVKISGKGLTKCALAEFAKPGGKANCPAKSKAGVGITHAVLGPQRAPLNFKVSAYVGGNNLVIFYIEQIGGSVTKALQGKISSASGKYKQKLVIDDPAGPAAAHCRPVRRAHRSQDARCSTRRARTASSRSIGCKKKKHTFGAKLDVCGQPEKPAPKPSASGTSTAKCS